LLLHDSFYCYVLGRHRAGHLYDGLGKELSIAKLVKGEEQMVRV